MSLHALLLRREGRASRLIAAATLSSACFGAAVGSYTGRWQIVYDAAKMPVYLLGTLAISFAAMHLFAARDLRSRETFAVAIETVALTAVVLGALAPIVWLLSLSLPFAPGHRNPESEREQALAGIGRSDLQPRLSLIAQASDPGARRAVGNDIAEGVVLLGGRGFVRSVQSTTFQKSKAAWFPL
jgi:hypothetical protein